MRFHAPDRAAWTAWLEQHHASAQEVFLVFYRLATGRPCITYDEAVVEALRFGWIDGVKHRLDQKRYTYRFTPRRPGSRWSDANKRRVAALEAAGTIRPAGLAAIASARASGVWDRPARAATPEVMPAELEAALRRSRAARNAYDALAPGKKRQWQRWIHDAKQEATRVRRAATAAEQLARGRVDPGRG